MEFFFCFLQVIFLKSYGDIGMGVMGWRWGYFWLKGSSLISCCRQVLSSAPGGGAPTAQGQDPVLFLPHIGLVTEASLHFFYFLLGVRAPWEILSHLLLLCVDNWGFPRAGRQSLSLLSTPACCPSPALGLLEGIVEHTPLYPDLMTEFLSSARSSNDK